LLADAGGIHVADAALAQILQTLEHGPGTRRLIPRIESPQTIETWISGRPARQQLQV
jgi:hypothetical protein